VHVQIMGEGFLDVFAARDISAGGVSIAVPHRFEGCAIDDDVDLVISLPGERPFMARGRIVHRTKTSLEFFGVEFTRIANAHAASIERYVDGRLRESR
jgi:c-di-GMP-binding flagellar brake protein YcgR